MEGHRRGWQWHVGQDALAFSNLTGVPALPEKSEARGHFETGVGLLYSFLYPLAAEEFRMAISAARGPFPMAAWGLAMTCFQPLWMSEQPCADHVSNLTSLLENSEMTKVEQAFLRVPLAYLRGQGNVSREERKQFMLRAALELYQIRSEYDDPESTGLLALAINFVISPGELGYEYRAQQPLPIHPNHPNLGANATSMFAFGKSILALSLSSHPLHPHLLHMRIHLLDTPDNAEEGVSFGRADDYAISAESAWHARHMPAHLAVRLGNWTGVIKANSDAVSASLRYIATSQRFEDLPDLIDSHSMEFLHYGYVQRGQFEKADALLQQQIGFRHWTRVNLMAARQYSAESLPGDKWPARVTCDSCMDPENLDEMYLWSHQANTGLVWAQGIAGARAGNSSLARSCAEELRKMAEEVRPYSGLFSSFIEAAAWQVEGLRAYLVDGDSSGMEMVEMAVRMEAELGKATYGPPIVSPAAELLGEIYLKDNRPIEAEKGTPTCQHVPFIVA
mmetsp:Transcript_17303/g.32837  ORF Transcript_17303/g.32837 Transcript_17303/m.32837 type:complete len:507 (-) Transcript_17303:629-2149(-)